MPKVQGTSQKWGWNGLERAAKHIIAKDGKESVESYVLDMIQSLHT